MKLVETAVHEPARCAVTADIDGPFIDTETWCQTVDPRIYLHVPYVEELGRFVGMRPLADFEALAERVKRMEAEILDLRGTLAKYEVVESLTADLGSNGDSA